MAGLLINVGVMAENGWGANSGSNEFRQGQTHSQLAGETRVASTGSEHP